MSKNTTHFVTSIVTIEITFDDLIEAHERKHGHLWKYGGKNDNWISSDSEKELYCQITQRIEDNLERLTKIVVCKDK